ncbi:MAG: DnaJ domain-containing protein, partial [Pseudomonadales bacterium]|nr:DnaJ domain-containing protein [Pseudomonadales bacterium]
SEIKKAFKSKALKAHPDRNGGNEALFKQLEEAHRILSDADKRKTYDRTGKAGIEITIEDRAVTLLSNIFNQIITKRHFTENIVNRASCILKESDLRLTHDLKIMITNHTEIAYQIGRVESKKETNMFDWILEEKSKTLTDKMKEVNEQLLVVVLAAELLDEYTDTRPGKETVAATTFTTGIFNTTGS